MTASDMTSTTLIEEDALKALTWLLEQFTDSVPGVTHALLVSRDGIKLLDNGLDRDWADKQAAAMSGIASLAANAQGPDGRPLGPPRQILLEYDDRCIFVQSTGRTSLFPNAPGGRNGMHSTVLCVMADERADFAAVGYEMSELTQKFTPYLMVADRAQGADGR
ncbi:roadblock/LC7 domain-containing protein [Streptomyces sp. 4F14]|uniref:roadblock/LC7 domain-containing protein n=1 Tax=Streptomyces sp. 4F14 TaxID=3394380 RepID=UPI003A87EA8E